MRIPVITGVIKRRLLVNFRAPPEVAQRMLPAPFRPKLHLGHAIVGVCLIRLESLRPRGLPEMVGLSSENAAHRIAVEWIDRQGVGREGVFIPRRDTGSIFTRVTGGRLFPGEHHLARFKAAEEAGRISLEVDSMDGEVKVRIVGRETGGWPASSCFSSVQDSSAFFEAGSLGYSVTREAGRFDGLRLSTAEWRVSALEVETAYSSYFSDSKLFPENAIAFDHALIMRDVRHEWHQEDDLRAV